MASKKSPRPAKRRRLRFRGMTKQQRVELRMENEENDRKRGVIQVGLHMPVVAFAPGSALRDAARIWWAPMGERIDKLTRNITWGWVSELRKLDPATARLQGRSTTRRRKGRQLRPIAKGKPRVKVRLTLDYPMSQSRSSVVTLDRRFPGEVFGLCHDFYKAIYAEDPGNIWGHALTDLTFRGVVYTPLRKNAEGVEGEFTFDIGS